MQLTLNIINTLVRDGRISMGSLADIVGLSKTPVTQRVKKLEQQGVIEGYGARINHGKLDLEHIAFVQITLSDTRSAALDAFNQAVCQHPKIEQCHMIAGAFDYLLKIRTRDISQYRKLLGETLSALPHVSHTSTFVVMETIKEY